MFAHTFNSVIQEHSYLLSLLWSSKAQIIIIMKCVSKSFWDGCQEETEWALRLSAVLLLPSNPQPAPTSSPSPQVHSPRSHGIGGFWPQPTGRHRVVLAEDASHATSTHSLMALAFVRNLPVHFVFSARTILTFAEKGKGKATYEWGRRHADRRTSSLCSWRLVPDAPRGKHSCVNRDRHQHAPRQWAPVPLSCSQPSSGAWSQWPAKFYQQPCSTWEGDCIRSVASWGNDFTTKLSLPSHERGVRLFLRLFMFSPVLLVKSTKFFHEASEYLLGLFSGME